MLDQLELIHFASFALLGFVGGMINACSGGAALILVPALLFLGIGPVETIATLKFQALFGSFTSACYFNRKQLYTGQPVLSNCWIAMLFSALGSLCLLSISVKPLELAIPVLLLALTLSSLLVDPEKAGNRLLLTPQQFQRYVVPALGFYGGVFGVSIGNISAYVFNQLQGLSLLRSVAASKPLIFAINLISVIIFTANSLVIFPVAVSMLATQILGALVGSKIAISLGSKLLRLLIAASSILMATILLAKSYNSLIEV